MGVPQPGKMDVTLVAHYGDKPLQITQLINEAINELSRLLGDSFTPYPLPQIHGTIIGLEGRRADGHIISTNYAMLHNQLRSQDLTAMLEILKDQALLPFDVVVGGYADGGPYTFTSRNVVPYLRSFSIQGTDAVAMGWPSINGIYSKSLDQLRRAFNSANIMHKYHLTPTSEDNDFFFVLGKIIQQHVDQNQLLEAQGRLRALFAARSPVHVPISRDCLRIIGYLDKKLPLDTSCAYTLDEAEKNIDAVRSLYREILR